MSVAMPFFKELRRRSKASFRTNASGESHNGDVTSGKSSSTLDTTYSTPPSSIKRNLSTPNLPALNKSNGTLNGSTTPVQSLPPQRPVPITSQSNRNSFFVRFLAIPSPRVRPFC